jgi:excisionase family DNA binding protein
MTSMNNLTDAFDIARAAAYLGVTASTLRSWKTKGTGPKYYRAGRLIRYRVAQLDAWIERRSECSDNSEPNNQPSTGRPKFASESTGD